MLPRQKQAARCRCYPFWSHCAGFLRRWFLRPAALERCLDRKTCACEPRRQWLQRSTPAVMALEGREAPQFLLFGAAAAAVGGAALVAIAQSHAGSVIHSAPTDALDRLTSETPGQPMVGHESTPRHLVTAVFAQSAEAAPLADWTDIGLWSFDNLAGDARRDATDRSGFSGGPDLTPAGEGAFGLPSAFPEFVPAPSLLAEPTEPESGGGGDSPNLVGKAPPSNAVTPATSAPVAAPGPSASATPPSSFHTTGGEQTNELAHG